MQDFENDKVVVRNDGRRFDKVLLLLPTMVALFAVRALLRALLLAAALLLLTEVISERYCIIYPKGTDYGRLWTINAIDALNPEDMKVSTLL